MCHRTPYTTTYDSDSGHYEAGISRTYASGEGSSSRGGKEVHAAATIECMDCHAAYWAHNHQGTKEPEYEKNCGVGICHYSKSMDDRKGFIAAGGFGLTLHPLDNGSKAAHTMFVLDAINESLMARRKRSLYRMSHANLCEHHVDEECVSGVHGRRGWIW